MDLGLMNTLLLIVHFIICIAMIVVVLLQADKGVGLSGAFGGGASQTIFGTGGGIGFLGKVTTGMAALFMLTSLGLYIISVSTHKTAPTSQLQNTRPPIEAPAVPVGVPGL
jgi:preprotein translocase subunit SecG